MRSSLHWFTILGTIFYSCRAGGESVIEDLNQYLQPDDVLEYYEFAATNDTKSCTRVCEANSKPRICYYKFFVENYAVMTEACGDCPQNTTECYNPQCVTADGYERGISTVNRIVPGPSIQVCLGDRIIVDVANKMSGSSTTIHWHGIFQEGTPWNDGVPMVSQCAILEGTFYRYDFFTKQAGTFYWHSHDGIQKSSGLQGSLNIRRPKEKEPNGDLYDYDIPAHTIFFNDWFHTGPSQHFPGLRKPDPILYGTYYLINGRGRFHNPEFGNTTNTPYTVFRVTRGKRYRFRIVGATCTHCPIRVSIESHNLTLIATDGNAVKPVVVDYLELFTGERYDFVVNATNDVKSYWIQVRGLGPCSEIHPYQVAILQYEGSNEAEPRTAVSAYRNFNENGVGLNRQNAKCGKGQRGVCVSELEAVEGFDKRLLAPNPDVNFTMTFKYFFPSDKEEFWSDKFYRFVRPEVNASAIVMTINNIYQVLPPGPILSQREDIPASLYCTKYSNGAPKCDQECCRCFQVLNIPLGKVAEFVLVDQSQGGGFNHPFHLHGNAFSVMAMGYVPKNLNNTPHQIAELVKNKLQQTPAPAPAMKDTIAVPSDGFAVFRFVSDNPGYWLLHCHFIHHIVGGMQLVVQVGEPEDMPPLPNGLPKCGNFAPPAVIKEEL